MTDYLQEISEKIELKNGSLYISMIISKEMNSIHYYMKIQFHQNMKVYLNRELDDSDVRL